MRPIKNVFLVSVVTMLLLENGIAGDLDGDGKSDVLWRNSVSGQGWLYVMDGISITANLPLSSTSGIEWDIAALADFDGDNDVDILWRNSGSGQLWLYLMQGANVVASEPVAIVSDPNWEIVGSGDFNSDGNSDVVWRNQSSGVVWLFSMDGAAILSSQAIATVSDLSWSVKGIGDFDGDGDADIFWRNSSNHQLWLFEMQGTTIASSEAITTLSGNEWKLVALGDFDGNATSDLLWRNQTSGAVWLYQMNGASIIANQAVTTIANMGWQVAAAGDYDGDGKSDVLWRNTPSGQLWLHTMDGASISASSPVSSITDLNWQVVDNIADPVTPSGLNARPANLACVAPDQPSENTVVSVTDAFPSLPGLTKPVALLQRPGDTTEWFVVEQDGRVSRFSNNSSADSLTTFIDITGPSGPVDVDSSAQEGGLLGMAFHPDFANNGEVFLSYTVDGPNSTYPLTSRVSRFTSNDGGATLDPTSEDVLISLDQRYDNHNGGHIAFGPDGLLYVGFGDSGSSGDPGDRSQDTTILHGSVIRIDPDGAVPYSIPQDNPFAGNALCSSGDGSEACPEIYAWGFRNPWRWSFDSGTGDLWMGDVGQARFEEVNIVELGGNYGWRCREASSTFDTSGVCPQGLIDPVIEYDRSLGFSITGGYVYRGTDIPQLAGRYVFADYVTGRILASTDDGQGGYGSEQLIDTNLNIASFAEDENGELLFINYSGDIRRIVQSGSTSTNTIPSLLSETGCVDPVNPTQVVPALVPYELNAPFWSDGADKRRWYSIPDGTAIDIDAEGDWLFPVGTVLMKDFRLNGELFETRLFMRHTNGEWAGYTYEWNSEGSDAVRVVGGKTKTVQGQEWTYPSGSQCMNCHTQVANFSLGLEIAQLNRSMTYPNGIRANPLHTASLIGHLADPLPGDVESLDSLFDLGATSTPESSDLEIAARSYLHTNCASCHQPVGPTPSSMDLRYSTPLNSVNVCNVSPVLGDLGVSDARLVAAGDSARSIVVNRALRRDSAGMPPLGSHVVDAVGVGIVSDWIDALESCPPADWQGTDIGSVGAAGSFSTTSGVYTINASGADIWGTSDEFHFVYKTIDGDGELIARVESLTNTDQWAKSGVMVRESLAANSKHAMVLVTPENGSGIHYRSSTGGSSSFVPPSEGTTAPIWLRVVRSGSTITGYQSDDGVVWTELGEVNISMNNTVQIGLAVTSHNDGVITTSVIDNLMLN